MDAVREGDADWRNGRTSLHVYWAGDDVQEVALRAYGMFMNGNPLAPGAFPSLRWFEDELIAASLPLWGAPAGAAAAVTSGGTESILLAMQAIRGWARQRRPTPDHPTVLLPSSAHPAYDKAADLLDLRVKRIPVAADYRLDPAAARAALDGDVVALVGSAPCLPFGTIDPIAELGELALEADLWLHVDACLGGYLAPFVRRLGHPVPSFDFSTPGVRSLSADLHKYGYAPKGVSMIAYRDAVDLARQGFRFSDWPKGRYETLTVAGTRSGGAIAAAWAVMNYLGEAGYMERAAQVFRARAELEAGLARLGGFEFFGRQPLGVSAFGRPGADMLAVSHRLSQYGWYVSRIARPPGLHMTITPAHTLSMAAYVEDLGRALLDAGHSGVARAREVDTY
jgi:glutamate/tyrosine decarboxylase-like PLP-dependent enzyme